MERPDEAPPKVVVAAASELEVPRARCLAADLAVSFASPPYTARYLLLVSARGLELRENSEKRTSPVRVDFCSGPLHHRRLHGANRSSLLAKAIGARSRQDAPYVLDATAGLGRDAFILSSLGCRVLMLERSPILWALLQDGLERGKGESGLADTMARLSLLNSDARDYLRNPSGFGELPEVAYLDPMFPHEDRSALIKREMLVCRDLVGDDLDADSLFAAACDSGIPKVVVKRMRSAPFLGHKKASHQIAGKTNRFDVYALPPRAV